MNELLSKTKSKIKDKVKVVLDLSNYAIKDKLNDAADVDTSNLAAKSNFVVLKSEVEKLDINKFVNVPTGLNNFKTKSRWFRCW